MKISDFKILPRRIPLSVPYRIAGRFTDTAEIVFLFIMDEIGREGYGAASPVVHLTGDDFEGAAEALQAMLESLTGAELRSVDAAVARAASVAPHARSARAALDIALHDLEAKRRGVPLVRLLGGVRRKLITSVTVGIDAPQAMAEAAARHVARGFKAIKVKIGEDAASDLIRVRRIREAVGPSVRIRVDANQGYTARSAVEVAGELDGLAIELFEQPVAAGDLSGMREVGLATRAPVVADESVFTSRDLPALVGAAAARGANIKLMKCGGILEARRIDEALSEAGWRALVGCMDESRISIAAAAHFAAASATSEWIDLDGHLDLAADPFSGGVEIRDGEILLADSPGLGVSLRDDGAKPPRRRPVHRPPDVD